MGARGAGAPSAAGAAAMLGAAVLRAAPRGPLHKSQAGQRQAASARRRPAAASIRAGPRGAWPRAAETQCEGRGGLPWVLRGLAAGGYL